MLRRGAVHRAIGRLVHAQHAAVRRCTPCLVSGVVTFKCCLLCRPVHLNCAVLCQELASEKIAVVVRVPGRVVIIGVMGRLGRCGAWQPAWGPVVGSAELNELARCSRWAHLLSWLF